MDALRSGLQIKIIAIIIYGIFVNYGDMQKVIRNTNHSELAKQDKEFWLAQTAEIRLDAVEQLRIEAGRFLYEYPARLQRVVSVTRKAPR